MKKLLLVIVLFSGCVTSGTQGYIKTNNDDVIRFKNAHIVYLPNGIVLIKEQSEVTISKEFIKEIHFTK